MDMGFVLQCANLCDKTPLRFAVTGGPNLGGDSVRTGPTGARSRRVLRHHEEATLEP